MKPFTPVMRIRSFDIFVVLGRADSERVWKIALGVVKVEVSTVVC